MWADGSGVEGLLLLLLLLHLLLLKIMMTLTLAALLQVTCDV